MDAPQDRDPLPKPLLEAQILYPHIRETLARMQKLEIEMAALAARIRWQIYLGYDERAVEFVKKLDTRPDQRVN